MRMLQNYVYEFVAIYADDLVVYSKDFDTHIDVHLRKVFQKLREFNLKLKPSKVELCTKSFKWCGNLISVEGIRPDPDRVKAVMDMPIPQTLKDLRSFLGAANFLRKWIPHFADLIEPLRPLLKKGQFQSPLSQEQIDAIESLKGRITTQPCLAHPRWDCPWEIHSDASKTAIGAALMNRLPDGSLAVVAVMSKTLNDAQQNYAVHEQEALAALFAMETWRTYIFGQTVTLWTDSAALKFLVQPGVKYQGRLLRWLLRFSEFDMTIRHKKGVTNHLPDFLSRLDTGDSIGTGVVHPLTVTTRAARKRQHAPDAMSVSNEKPRKRAHLQPTDRVANAEDEKHSRINNDDQTLRRSLRRRIPTLKNVQNVAERIRAQSRSTARTPHHRCAPDKSPPQTEDHQSRSTVRTPHHRCAPDSSSSEALDAKDTTEIEEVWTSLFPSEEFNKRQIMLRPDITLFHTIKDTTAHFVKEMTSDEWIQKTMHKIRACKCHGECTACTHHPTCIRRFWRISENGLLYKRCIQKPINPSMNAHRIIQSLTVPCTCHSGSTCLHRQWVLDPPHTGEQKDQTRQKVRKIREVVVVPETLITSVLFHFHGSAIGSHAGVSRTHNNIVTRFYWRGLTRHVRRWIGACLPCRQRKTSRNHHASFPGIMPVTGPWHTVAIDFQGPFYETKRGNKYVLGIICTYSKWPICVPLPSRKAHLVVRALLEHLICNFSCPKYLIADNAPEFLGTTLTHFCKIFGIKKIHTPAYTPRLNPFIERYHGWQSVGMTILTSRWKNDWDLYLPMVTFAYRTSVARTTGWSPFHINFARDPNLPLDNLLRQETSPNMGDPECKTECEYVTDMENALRDIRTQLSATMDRSAVRDLLRRKDSLRSHHFTVGQFVLTFAPRTAETLPDGMARKDKMLDRWSEPKRVIEKLGSSGRFIVQDCNGNIEDVIADSMIPYEFYYDGKPSIASRRRFTAAERKILRQNPEAYLPPIIRVGDLVAFPLTMADRSDGFGIGRILQEIHSGRMPEYDAQWYSNDSESLSGPFLPCWIDDQKKWYAGKRKCVNDIPMRTNQYYVGIIRQDRVADVAFELDAESFLPGEVYIHMERHQHFRWRRTKQTTALSDGQTAPKQTVTLSDGQTPFT